MVEVVPLISDFPITSPPTPLLKERGAHLINISGIFVEFLLLSPIAPTTAVPGT
jgi:hypothetical protein